jgi:4-amino-4-deoxy-L-arabinose transferase-like glycosyltransferase
MEGHAGNPLIYYPVALLIGFFPWSVLAIPGCLWVARQRGSHGYSWAYKFLLAWIAVYVGAFSLASTKLPNYVTPTYPAIALLCGHFLSIWPLRCEQPAAWWPRWSSAVLIVVGLAMLIAIPIAAHQFLPGDSWLAWIGLIPVCGGTIMLVQCLRHRIPAAMRQLAISAVAWTIGLFGLVAPRVSDHQQFEQLLVHAARDAEQVSLMSYGVHEPSWVFYAGQPIRFLPADAVSEAAEQLRKEQILLITSEPYHARLLTELPPDVQVLAEVPYFLRSERLLLIGHRERRISRK